MRDSFALLCAATLLGACARLNPAFGDGQESASSGQGATTESALDTTRGTTDAETSGGDGGTTGDASSSGFADSGSVGDSDSSGDDTGWTESPIALMWVTPVTMGDWDNERENPCVLAVDDVQDICAEPPVEIVGRTIAPLEALPAFHPFLEEARFYSARTDALVVKSYAELLEGRVEANFVDELVSGDDQPDIYAWRGPQGQLPEANCSDWVNPEVTGSGWLFLRQSAEVSFDVSAPCVSELHLLCTCPVRF